MRTYVPDAANPVFPADDSTPRRRPGHSSGALRWCTSEEAGSETADGDVGQREERRRGFGERGQRGADEGNGMGGDGSAGPDDVTGGLPGPDAGKQAAGGSGARAEDDLAGRLLGGRYRVTGRIGRGGMGVVCRAVDEVLGREVAVKVLRAYTDASAPELADLRTRMQREARAAARIRHSGVITVHDVIDEGGRPVIVMELVDGPSLDDAVGRRGGIEPREMAAIGARVMDALDAAHRAGVLHRDVKPGNVLLDSSGRVVLTDFGIASIEAPGDGAETNITRSGELVGSLDYLPPERAQGMGPSPASDIWSLGMTLYAAVEGGTAPFRRTSVYSTLTAIVTEPLPEPQRAGPLTPVLHALMAKNPADRPDAARAREMLQAVADGGDPGPCRCPAHRICRRPRTSSRWARPRRRGRSGRRPPAATVRVRPPVGSPGRGRRARPRRRRRAGRSRSTISRRRWSARWRRPAPHGTPRRCRARAAAGGSRSPSPPCWWCSRPVAG